MTTFFSIATVKHTNTRILDCVAAPNWFMCLHLESDLPKVLVHFVTIGSKTMVSVLSLSLRQLDHYIGPNISRYHCLGQNQMLPNWLRTLKINKIKPVWHTPPTPALYIVNVSDTEFHYIAWCHDISSLARACVCRHLLI